MGILSSSFIGSSDDFSEPETAPDPAQDGDLSSAQNQDFPPTPSDAGQGDNAQFDGPGISDWSDMSDMSDESDPSDPSPTSRQPNAASATTGDASPSSAPSGASPAPRQRLPARQIGQIPDADDSWKYSASFATPAADDPRSLDERHAAFMQMVQRSQDRDEQIAQINASDPYISDDDGRWKKQTADFKTGAIHESDVLDTGTGNIDRATGDIYVQTAQGPQFIGVDPQQQRLAEIVGQKAQAQAQGSPADSAIATTSDALLDAQRQLQSFQGIPERMTTQIAKYTQASLDPANIAAADQLQSAQAAFAAWKQQNPSYTALSSRRDALSNQLQAQTDAKAQSQAQLAQLLTTPQYVQWSANTPPSPWPDASGQHDSANDGSPNSPNSPRGCY
jgi:hypothetical protein